MTAKFFQDSGTPDVDRPEGFESILEDYPVKLENFEGPLDLLLHLIRKNEVDIYDIPITVITQQYLEYLELMKELDLDSAGEFLVMAATLIQIKARMLVPRAEVEAEEMRMIEVTVGGQEEPSEESQDATAQEGQVPENA